MQDLDAIAAAVGERLKAGRQTVAVAESSAGGLVSAALLGVPGASAYYDGGAVIYTAKARALLLEVPREAVAGMRSQTQDWALLLARSMRERFGSTWGLGETGSAGPTGSYDEAPGRTWVAISGPVELAFKIETGSPDRLANMNAFAAATLRLLEKALG
jgi:nicotinamide-nucleotide amidase